MLTAQDVRCFRVGRMSRGVGRGFRPGRCQQALRSTTPVIRTPASRFSQRLFGDAVDVVPQRLPLAPEVTGVPQPVPTVLQRGHLVQVAGEGQVFRAIQMGPSCAEVHAVELKALAYAKLCVPTTTVLAYAALFLTSSSGERKSQWR